MEGGGARFDLAKKKLIHGSPSVRHMLVAGGGTDTGFASGSGGW